MYSFVKEMLKNSYIDTDLLNFDTYTSIDEDNFLIHHLTARCQIGQVFTNPKPVNVKNLYGHNLCDKCGERTLNEYIMFMIWLKRYEKYAELLQVSITREYDLENLVRKRLQEISFIQGRVLQKPAFEKLKEHMLENEKLFKEKVLTYYDDEKVKAAFNQRVLEEQFEKTRLIMSLRANLSFEEETFFKEMIVENNKKTLNRLKNDSQWVVCQLDALKKEDRFEYEETILTLIFGIENRKVVKLPHLYFRYLNRENTYATLKELTLKKEPTDEVLEIMQSLHSGNESLTLEEAYENASNLTLN